MAEEAPGGLPNMVAYWELLRVQRSACPGGLSTGGGPSPTAQPRLCVQPGPGVAPYSRELCWQDCLLVLKF